jgi:hypothetical protein
MLDLGRFSNHAQTYMAHATCCKPKDKADHLIITYDHYIQPPMNCDTARWGSC